MLLYYSSFAKSVTVVFMLWLALFNPDIAIAADDTGSQVFARYARYGADVWATNPSATISGEGKACVSCRTSLPYALVEPLLAGTYAAYTDLIENTNERVLTWQYNTPWYSNQKAEYTATLGGLPPDALKEILDAEGSRGVESIFNAFILAMHDAYEHSPAEPETVKAFENMWSEQTQTGANAGGWKWIKANLIPWEVEDSDLWGASLACVAASLYPDQAPPRNRELLYASLRQGAIDDSTSLHVKAAIVWCDTETGGELIEKDIAESIVADLLNVQFSNGGWAIRQLGPWSSWEGSASDCCAQREVRPDAYATGFAAFVLARSRYLVGADNNAKLVRAHEWIEKRLANPYSAEPRNNRHESSEEEFPQFRNNIYTNAGHMWAFLAKTVLEDGKPPWSSPRMRSDSRD